MSAPPPIKKLKQTTLSFNTTTQLDQSATSTSHREDDSDQEDTHTVTDEEIACTSECRANVCDEQARDSLRFSQRIQAPSNGLVGGKAKKSSFFSKLVCNLSLDNPLYYKSSSILCVLSLLWEEGLEFG